MAVGFLISWLLAAALIAVAAHKQGRSPFPWGLLSLVVSPLVVVIALAMVEGKE